MFCPNCGEPKEKGVVFCPYCGIQIGEEPQEVVIDEKDKKIQVLQSKIAQLQQQASQGGHIGHLEQQIADLQHQLRLASRDVRKTKRTQSYCCYCIGCYILIMVIVLATTFIVFSF